MPASRKSQAKATKAAKASANALLHSLLRTPKTQKGLVAAAGSRGVPRHWVYGWLSSAMTKGVVVKIWRGDEPQYLLSREDPNRAPAIETKGLPAWMQPPKPPTQFAARRVYRVVGDNPVPQEQEQKDTPCKDKPRKPRTRTAPPGSSST